MELSRVLASSPWLSEADNPHLSRYRFAPMRIGTASLATGQKTTTRGCATVDDAGELGHSRFAMSIALGGFHSHKHPRLGAPLSLRAVTK
jgi:hypothetical protein